MRLIQFTVCLLLICNISKAQNFAYDMASINSAYFNLNKQIHVTARATQGGQSNITEYVAYMRDMDSYFMASETTELLVDSSVKIALNKQANMILIDSNQLNDVNDLPVQVFDTMAKAYSSIKKSFLQNGNAKYTLVPLALNVDIIEIEFNPKSKLISKIIVRSTPAQDGSINELKVNYRYKPLNAGDIPKVEKYLKFDSEGTASLTSTYSGYTLINYLNR